jgi:hypothetical protein
MKQPLDFRQHVLATLTFLHSAGQRIQPQQESTELVAYNRDTAGNCRGTVVWEVRGYHFKSRLWSMSLDAGFSFQ